MATNTYVALQTQTLGSSSASVTFSSIPATYTDLYIVIEAKNLTGNSDVLMRFNSDSGSNYSATILTGDGSSASSARRTSSTSVILNYFDFLNSTTATQFNVNIQNYSNATTNKTALVRANRANQATEAVVGLWRNTAAITQIDLTPSSSSFAVGSTFSLYGIASAEVGAKATGGIISSDSQYYYHTFLASGTFTPTQSLSCDYLVVAGGGAGGSSAPGGGGAGGLRSTVTATGGGGSLETPLSLSATGYTVTIGGGGALNTSSGTDSVFSTITSVGGGLGGGANTGLTSPLIGGSGGGGREGSGPKQTGAAGTANQGFAGGSGNGGGGGAGAVGFNGFGLGVNLANSGGIGGAGVATSISGSSVTYASGGSAYYSASGTPTRSPNPTSGGGGGATTNNGVANTGGGGAADYGAGGSGIVIVRYAK